MEPRKAAVLEKRLIKLNCKLVSRESQLHLLHEAVNSELLLKSKILASVRPKVGKEFGYLDLELKKASILAETRKRILLECALVEANRDILKLGKEISDLHRKLNPTTELLSKLSSDQNKVRSKMRQELLILIHIYFSYTCHLVDLLSGMLVTILLNTFIL
jgi:hypothetical protein